MDGSLQQACDALDRYVRTGDREAREQAVLGHRRLAWAQARRYVTDGVELEELRQVALIGLIKAVDRFDPGRGGSFVAFAIPTIRGELLRHLRDATWCVAVPRTTKELANQVRRAEPRLAQTLGRSPSPAELAARVGVARREVSEAMLAWGSRHRGQVEPDGDDLAEVAEIDDGYHRVEARVTIERLLDGVDTRTRQLLEFRFGRGMTQQEIAERIGCSQVHVSRLLRRSLADLRRTA